MLKGFMSIEPPKWMMIDEKREAVRATRVVRRGKLKVESDIERGSQMGVFVCTEAPEPRAVCSYIGAPDYVFTHNK